MRWNHLNLARIWPKPTFREKIEIIWGWLHHLATFLRKIFCPIVNFCCRTKRDITLVTLSWNDLNRFQIWSNLKFEKKLKIYEAGYTIWTNFWRNFWQIVIFCCRTKRDLTLVTLRWNHINLLRIWSNHKFEKKMKFYEAGYTIWLQFRRKSWAKSKFLLPHETLPNSGDSVMKSPQSRFKFGQISCLRKNWKYMRLVTPFGHIFEEISDKQQFFAAALKVT